VAGQGRFRSRKQLAEGNREAAYESNSFKGPRLVPQLCSFSGHENPERAYLDPIQITARFLFDRPSITPTPGIEVQELKGCPTTGNDAQFAKLAQPGTNAQASRTGPTGDRQPGKDVLNEGRHVLAALGAPRERRQEKSGLGPSYEKDPRNAHRKAYISSQVEDSCFRLISFGVEGGKDPGEGPKKKARRFRARIGRARFRTEASGAAALVE